MTLPNLPNTARQHERTTTMPYPQIKHDDPTPQQSAEHRKADAFRFDPGMERLHRMRTTDPAGFRLLSAQMKTSLGYYTEARRAAEAVGMDITDPGPHAA
jgi:hypothetical protein